MVVMLPLDATSGSPAFTAQQTRQAFSAFLGSAPAGRPLGAISGVRPGTPTTTAFLSGGGSTTWNVAAHSGILDTQTAAAAGPYIYATDGSDTGSITAANASNPRIDILYVKVNDNVQDGSGLTSGQVLYLAGTAAPSPVQPATPARGMAIAKINVPTSGGGAPTVSWIAPTFHTESLLIQTGSTTSSGVSVAGGGSATVTITFPVPYSTAPTFYSAQQAGSVSGGSLIFPKYIDTVTTTSMRLVMFNSGGTQATWTNMPIVWTTIGTP